MGISASVMCNCYRDGLTTPCPFPDQFVADPDALPALEWETPPNEEQAEAAYNTLRSWLETCCAHPNMNIANEFITSWKGYQSFTDALEAVDPQRFQHLLAQLPDGDDGITRPAIARLMLAELDDFANVQATLRHAVLMDDERATVISMGSHILSGALAVDPITGLDVGFNEQGFFVRDRWEMNRLLFQAMRFEQRLLLPEISQVEYADLDSDRTFVCNTAFGKTMVGEDGLPRMVFQRLRVELIVSSENRFAYITDPLRRVLQAALDTDHPVRWH